MRGMCRLAARAETGRNPPKLLQTADQMTEAHQASALSSPPTEGPRTHAFFYFWRFS
jgi:hypothetical protein